MVALAIERLESYTDRESSGWLDSYWGRRVLKESDEPLWNDWGRR
ncbi:MAG: hypothetical protein OJF50_006478 [Nitrospira sp.]|nr:hypothetical protein [Nitrospira sp.]